MYLSSYFYLLLTLYALPLECCKKIILYQIFLQLTVINKVPHFFVVFLEICMTIDVIIYLTVLILGFLSIITNKSNVYGWLSIFGVIEIFSAILLWYIHQLYLIAFIGRTIFYVYTRYIISLLHSILLMPS